MKLTIFGLFLSLAANSAIAEIIEKKSEKTTGKGDEAAQRSGKADKTEKADKTQASKQIQSVGDKAYVLRVKGRALPFKAATIDGVNVLGGPIVFMKLPLNITGYINKGLNEIELEYVSHPDSELLVTVEKRTPGPKSEEIAKIVIPADDSKGEIGHKKLSFNIPEGEETVAIKELSEQDKKSIQNAFGAYYNSIKEHRPDKLKLLYKESLDKERRLCPESVQFFEKVLNKETQLIKNTLIEVPALDLNNLVYAIEGNCIRLHRESNKPLIVSNDFDVSANEVMEEVAKSKVRRKAKKGEAAGKANETGKDPVHSKIKERLVKLNLYLTKAADYSAENPRWILSVPPNL
ncbi:MAG: hypothetical protein K2Y32_18940 [Candidatus Obscuribacterales bacterium]|nr:hypothetical protein [Candidatus Obscuribacterales bacterium]